MAERFAGFLMAWLILAASSSVHAENQPMNFATISPEDIEWVLIPDALGAQYAVVHGDPAKAGTYVVRVRFPAGVMDYPHSHSADRPGRNEERTPGKHRLGEIAAFQNSRVRLSE